MVYKISLHTLGKPDPNTSEVSKSHKSTFDPARLCSFLANYGIITHVVVKPRGTVI